MQIRYMAELQLDVAAGVAPSQAPEHVFRLPETGAARLFIEPGGRPVGLSVHLRHTHHGPFAAPGGKRLDGHVLGALVAVADENGDGRLHAVDDPDVLN